MKEFGGGDVGVRWNWGSSKVGKKRLTLDTTRAFVFTPRALRPLGEDSPIELISVFHAHMKSLLRKPSWGRRGRKKKTTQILFCWVSHLFENEMKGSSEMLMEIFANTCLKLLPSKESLSYKYVWVIWMLPKVTWKLLIFPQRSELFIASKTCLRMNAFLHPRQEKVLKCM